MVFINNIIEAHKKFLYTYSKLLNLTSRSNKIINMPYIPSSPLSCPICLKCKMVKTQLLSSKPKKKEISCLYLKSLATIKIKRVILWILKKPPPSASTPTTSIYNNTPTHTHIIRPSLSLPDSSYPLGVLLHMDFTFYDTVSICIFIYSISICLSPSCKTFSSLHFPLAYQSLWKIE